MRRSLGTGTLANGVAILPVSTVLPVGTYNLTATYSGDTNFAGSNGLAAICHLGVDSAAITFTVPNQTLGNPPFVVAATSVIAGRVHLLGAQRACNHLRLHGDAYRSRYRDPAGKPGSHRDLRCRDPERDLYCNEGNADHQLRGPGFARELWRCAHRALRQCQLRPAGRIQHPLRSGNARGQRGHLHGALAPWWSRRTRRETRTTCRPRGHAYHHHEQRSSAGHDDRICQSRISLAPVILSATVASSAATPPTGSVTFSDGSNVLGTAHQRRRASITVSTLALGANTITAVYGGDGNYNTATSPMLNEAVQDFTFTVTGNTTQTIQYGGTATYALAVVSVDGRACPRREFCRSGAPGRSRSPFLPPLCPLAAVVPVDPHHSGPQRDRRDKDPLRRVGSPNPDCARAAWHGVAVPPQIEIREANSRAGMCCCFWRPPMRRQRSQDAEPTSSPPDSHLQRHRHRKLRRTLSRGQRRTDCPVASRISRYPTSRF